MTHTLKLKPGKLPKLNERVAISGPQSARLAEEVQRGQLERYAAGQDAHDTPMKPLTPNYAKRKLRKGAKPVRDIKMQGRTLRALDVIEADETGFAVGFQGDPEALKRAHFRQLADGFFGFSPANAQSFDVVLEYVFTELYTDLFEGAA